MLYVLFNRAWPPQLPSGKPSYNTVPSTANQELTWLKVILLYQREVALSLPFFALRELVVIAITSLAGGMVSGHFLISTKRY